MVGFEPTRTNTTDLKTVPLDRSGTSVCVWEVPSCRSLEIYFYRLSEG